MVKILHVAHAVGGVDVYLRLLIEAMDHTKFEHIIVKGKEDHLRDYYYPNGKPVKTYELPIVREINLINDIKVINQVIKILKKENPSIVHAHSAKGGIIARTASLFHKVKVLHTPHAYSYLSEDYGLKRQFFLLLERMFKHVNSRLLATSKSEANRGIKDVGYKAENVFLFNNSIRPIDNFNELSIEKKWPDNYICSVGRPSYQKNIELMLDVLNHVKKEKSDIHLVLMGVGFHSPNLECVEKKIKLLELQTNVTLLEWTKREDIFNIIKDSKLYISTSRYEGLPYSVIESLYLGKPIIATDVDGNRDLVINNYNGILVQEEDVEALSNGVLGLLNSESMICEFSKHSKALFDEKFNMNKNIKNLEDIYLNNV